jgi:DNA replication licensing factor MCM4
MQDDDAQADTII